jgi:hypothetical protein
MAWAKFNRLISPALALFAIALAVMAVDGATAAICGDNPAWLPPTFSLTALETLESRIAGAEQLRHKGELHDAQLVILLGTSSANEGFDPAILSARATCTTFWREASR